MFVNSFRSFTCHTTKLYVFENFRVRFFFILFILFAIFSSCRSSLFICCHMQCAYYISVVRERDRRDNCEHKQCIKCSTKMLFHHIICIKRETKQKKNERESERELEKAMLMSWVSNSRCDSWQ